MKKNIYLIGLLLLASTLFVNAQTFNDNSYLIGAYQLSSQKINGTARAASMGNAFGALGGDFTSLSINPAGIGLYRSNEFVFTPSAYFSNSEISISGLTFSDNKYSNGINNIGYVGTINTGMSSESGLVSLNLAIGMNTVVNLNQSAVGHYDNSSKSFIRDAIVNQWANPERIYHSYLDNNIGDIDYIDWPTKLAWDTKLIYGDDGTDDQYQSILYPNEMVNQQINYIYKGGIKEYLLAVGLNFSHKFYIGSTIGIQDVDITKTKEYSEIIDEYKLFTYWEDNFIKGTGYNFKIGAIYKPINSVRLGLAFHTPTFFDLNDDMQLSMKSNLDQTYDSYGINLDEYRLNSPYKLIMSGAVVIGKFAILSIDGEIADYSTIKYNEINGDAISNLNGDVINSFENVFNLRLGGELRLSKYLSARAGMEYYPTPYKDGFSLLATRLSDNNSIYSLGLGYMANGFFADLAFRNSVNTYNVYNPQPNFENIKLKNSKNQVLLSIGFKF